VRRLLDFCGPLHFAAKIGARFNGRQIEGVRRFSAAMRDLGEGDVDEELEDLIQVETTARAPAPRSRVPTWCPPGAAGE